MRITAIKKRRQGMFSVWAYPDLVAVLDERTIAKAGLQEGSQISGEDMEDLKRQSLMRCAKQRAMNSLSRREHSKREMINKLKNHFDEDISEAVVHNLEQAGLINDQRFAQLYASELIEKKYFSPSRAQKELQARGIERELAQEVINDMDIDRRRQIVAFLERRYYDKLNLESGRKHAFTALYRLGWRSEELRRIIREYVESRPGLSMDGENDEF